MAINLDDFGPHLPSLSLGVFGHLSKFVLKLNDLLANLKEFVNGVFDLQFVLFVVDLAIIKHLPQVLYLVLLVTCHSDLLILNNVEFALSCSDGFLRIKIGYVLLLPGK